MIKSRRNETNETIIKQMIKRRKTIKKTYKKERDKNI